MKQIDIFYADDDDDDMMLFNEAVERISKYIGIKINLHIHKNGESLIENIKKNQDSFGIVFLDINMPFKSGFQLLEEIRKEPKTKTFPVIMYSTSSNQDNIDRSKSLGANFYVVKPYKFENLKNMLTAFIKMDWQNHRVNINSFLYKF